MLVTKHMILCTALLFSCIHCRKIRRLGTRLCTSTIAHASLVQHSFLKYRSLAGTYVRTLTQSLTDLIFASGKLACPPTHLAVIPVCNVMMQNHTRLYCYSSDSVLPYINPIYPFTFISSCCCWYSSVLSILSGISNDSSFPENGPMGLKNGVMLLLEIGD